MKRFPKEQWTLAQCLAYIFEHLSAEDADFMAGASEERMRTHQVYTLFGRWIRNNCGLWKHGTDRVAHDIVEAFKAGELQSPSLVSSRFWHRELPFDLGKTRKAEYLWMATKEEGNVMNTKEVRVDNSLLHPDNCSAVIMEAVIAKLKNERARDTAERT